MKKYLKTIPLIIYPYAYLIFLLVMWMMNSCMQNDEMFGESNKSIWYITLGIIILYNLYVIFIAVYNAVVASKNGASAYQLAKMNLIVKGCQIPAYIFHFILGLLGFVMSVWGIGLIIFSVCIDLITIILTGINSIGCTVKMKKEGIITTTTAIFTGIGSFVYCIDIVVAIVYVMLSKKCQCAKDI